MKNKREEDVAPGNDRLFGCDLFLVVAAKVPLSVFVSVSACLPLSFSLSLSLSLEWGLGGDPRGAEALGRARPAVLWIALSLSLYLSIFISIYLSIYVYVHLYIYVIYMKIHRYKYMEK